MNKNLQRLVALAVLVIFALSIVPAAFAEEDGEERENGAERERQLRIKDKDVAQAMERADQIREQLKEKKDRYLEARRAHLEKKEKLSELQRAARGCTADNEDCQTKKLDLKRGVQEHLLKTIELISRSLEKLQERVDNSQVLSAEEQQEARGRISELETQLEEKKAELQALSETATNKELRTYIRELKDLWHTVRKEQRWIVAQLTNSKQDNLVGIYTRYGDRAEAQIAKLAEQGTEVASLQELLANYNAKVEELKVAQGEARAAWLEAKSSPDALERARELQHAFREKAKETKTVLRELLQEIKEVRQELSAEEEATEETTEAQEETSASTGTSTETPAAGTEPATS